MRWIEVHSNLLFFNSDNKSKDLNRYFISGTMQKVYLFGIALLLAFASLSFASAGGPNEAIIRTIPAQSVWVADGVTEYRMDVYADTTHLPTELTSGIQWRLVKPQGLQNNIIITQAQFPVQLGLVDFFAGYTPFGPQTVSSSWSTVQRRTMNENVPAGQGYVASYWFKVMPGVGKTSTRFTLNSVIFSDSTYPIPNPLPYHVENVPFAVVPYAPHMTHAVVCDDESC